MCLLSSLKIQIFQINHLTCFKMAKDGLCRISESFSEALHPGDVCRCLFVGPCLQGKTSHPLEYEVPNVFGFVLSGNISPLAPSDTFLSLLSDSDVGLC